MNLVKKIYSYIMFVIPFTKSKVKEAEIILNGVDEALNVLQEQQNTIVKGVNETLDELMVKKGQAIKAIEDANELRKKING